MENVMTKDEVINLLKKDAISIEFKKVNGDLRFMVATLNPDTIPPASVTPEGKLAEEERKRAQSPDTLAVWSVDDHGWRSFRWENLIRVDNTDVESLFKSV